jgi:CheY-like chemotaxis protein
MGGTITVASTPAKGALFTFTVQAQIAESVELAALTSSRRVVALAPNQPPYRILVVEDQWTNRRLLVKLLATLGFEVQEAENGQEAVFLWQSWRPHLIWMDMRMPVMDGYEATRRIKASPEGQTTIIIALTASAFEEERSAILACGCEDFVRKPFQEQVLLDKMVEHLGVHYLYQQEQEPISITTPEEVFTPDMLSIMPSEWIAALHQAALRTDEKQILQLLEQIPHADRIIAITIEEWVNNYRCDKILDLTQSLLPPE